MTKGLEFFDSVERESEDKISKLRRKLESEAALNEVLVVVCGSYARREVTSGSDLDYFMVSQDDQKIDSKKVKKAVKTGTDRAKYPDTSIWWSIW